MDKIGVVSAFLAAILWGVVFTLDQKILSSMSPASWLATSYVVNGLILTPLLVIKRDEIIASITGSKWHLLVVIVALIFVSLASYFIFIAISRLGAARANIIEITYPFFVAIFSLIFLGEKLNLYFFVGALLIFLGSLIIIRFSLN